MDEILTACITIGSSREVVLGLYYKYVVRFYSFPIQAIDETLFVLSIQSCILRLSYVENRLLLDILSATFTQRPNYAVSFWMVH